MVLFHNCPPVTASVEPCATLPFATFLITEPPALIPVTLSITTLPTSMLLLVAVSSISTAPTVTFWKSTLSLVATVIFPPPFVPATALKVIFLPSM